MRSPLVYAMSSGIKKWRCWPGWRASDSRDILGVNIGFHTGTIVWYYYESFYGSLQKKIRGLNIGPK